MQWTRYDNCENGEVTSAHIKKDSSSNNNNDNKVSRISALLHVGGRT